MQTQLEQTKPPFLCSFFFEVGRAGFFFSKFLFSVRRKKLQSLTLFWNCPRLLALDLPKGVFTRSPPSALLIRRLCCLPRLLTPAGLCIHHGTLFVASKAPDTERIVIFGGSALIRPV